MYLMKNGTVLVSTVIILSLMSTLGCFMFKMMKNNNELGNLYEFDKDIYSLDKNEEVMLYKFMQELNKSKKENLNSESKGEGIFSKDFENKLEDNTLKYYKDDDKLFLKTNRNNDEKRTREIKYALRNEKIILIPTYKFEDSI
jgi:hypothetical protein